MLLMKGKLADENFLKDGEDFNPHAAAAFQNDIQEIEMVQKREAARTMAAGARPQIYTRSVLGMDGANDLPFS